MSQSTNCTKLVSLYEKQRKEFVVQTTPPGIDVWPFRVRNFKKNRSYSAVFQAEAHFVL